jgi:hypothetical protein
MSKILYLQSTLNLIFQGKTWNRITAFFVKEGTSEEHAAIASELSLCYLSVKHSLIYNSFGCNTKLSRHIFTNSEVRSKLSCGKTKAEALVTKVLALSSITDFLETS